MTNSYLVSPVTNPVSGTIRPPGSKSLTNRALVVAALAKGRSDLSGVLDCTDTQVMVESLLRLGIDLQHDTKNCQISIEGCAGRPTATSADLNLSNSGTSIRFLTALCAAANGEYRLDGNARMRQRPILDLVMALNALGADVQCESDSGCPPVVVRSQGLSGGVTAVAGDLSSQFLSALLMAAPCARECVEIQVNGELVSAPYIDMTLGVMARFGVVADCSIADKYVIQPQLYRATNYAIEPDASAASYFFAAAAITGGKVQVDGLAHTALQGDIQFIDALERMGCTIDRKSNSTIVQGGRLKGIDVDMNAISDTAQTLAVVALFAEGETRIRNIAHVRHKETDRIHALVTELNRMGVQVEEHDDGITIHPGPIRPTTVSTYDDHRMAMSFALAGLKVPGIIISEPGCTAKTYPQFFDDLEKLCGAH